MSGRIVVIAPAHPGYDGLRSANRLVARILREHAGEPWAEAIEARKAELARIHAECEREHTHAAD